MKKLLMFSLLLFSAICTYADSRLFFDDNLSIKPGETKTIELKLQNTERIKGLQFKLTFPEYITVLEDEEEEGYIVGTDRCGFLAASVYSNATVVNVGGLATKKKDYIPVSEGDDTGIITLIIEASNTAPVGIGKIDISDIEIVEETSGTLNPENCEFEISVVKECSVSVSTSDQTKGTVTGEGGVYDSGTQVTVSATPATGYKFVNWTSGETAVSTDNPYVFTVTDDINLVANFAPNQYTMTFVLDNNEDNVVKTQDYNSTLEAPTPTKNGYTFKGWNPEVPATVPAENMTFTAQWEANSSAQVTIDTDLTSQFNSLATTKWEGSSGQVGWAAPQVTTNSGLTVAAWERYNGSCDWTGDIMYTTVTGLVPGTYKIELYGAAAFTFGRGFGSTAFTGDFSKDTSDTYAENESINENTGVTLYATTSEGTVSDEIPIYYATNFNASGIATVTLNNVVVGSNGEIKIGLSKTSTSTNWHVVQLKGVTATVDAVSTFATFKSEANALYESPMNATVLSELQAAANVDLSSAGADEYKTAIETLQAKIANAERSIAAYITINDYFNFTQGKVTGDYSSITTAISNGGYVTAEEGILAIKAIRNSIVYAGASDTESISLIIDNPGFEMGNTNYWTVGSSTDTGAKSTSNETYSMDNSEGDFLFNTWQQGIPLTQNLGTLPAGTYTLMTTVASDEGTTVYLTINDDHSTSIITTGKTKGLTLNKTFTLDAATEVTIGVVGGADDGTYTAEGGKWYKADIFRMIKGEIVLPTEISLNKTSLDLTIGFNETLTADITPANTTDKSITWTSDNSAVATVENGVVTAVGIGNATITASANGAENVIASATITVTDVTPVAAPAFYSEIADGDFYIVNAATGKFLGGANDWGTRASQIEHGIPFTVAALPEGKYTFDSHTYESDVKHFFNGTYIDGVSTDLYIVATSDGKYSISTADGSQFVTAKTGTTVVDNSAANAKSVLAQWYFISKIDRDKMLASATDENPADATYYIKEANFSRNWGTTGKNVSAWTGEHTKGGNNENMNAMVQNTVTNVYQIIEKIPNGTYKLTVQAVTSGTAKFYANDVEMDIETKDDVNSQQIASNAFGGGYFKRELTVTVKNQTLKVGVKSDDTDKTLYFDNFELFMTSYTPFIINEDDSYDTDLEGEGDVTLIRTIKADTWNTFVVPFDIDNTTLKAQFGDNVKVAEFSEEANREFSTISFDEMQEDEAAISANRPVLLWTPIAGNTYTFKGVTVKTGEPIAEGGVNYEFVGTYAALITLKEGDYFIGNNMLWEADPDVTTVRGTRAYLRAKTPEARITDFRIGESETTGIVSIDNRVKSIDNATFDLQGRKVTNVKKGLYIKNSKKVVVR